MKSCIILIALLLVAPAASLAAFTYVDDASGTLASRGWLDPTSLFQQNISAAADQFGQLIDSDETILITVDTVSFAARAGGTFSFGQFLGTDGEGNNIWEQGPLTRILTGDNAGATTFGFDVLLGFDVPFVESNYWLDPLPQARTTPVDPGMGDFISVVMHELGHGFGIAGFRDHTPGPNYGEFFGPTITVFDSMTYFGGDGNPTDTNGDPNPMFFSGSAAANVFGGDVLISNVPQGGSLAGQNFYHLGTCGDPEILTGSLMNGCTIPNGERLDITPLDLAIFADLGYPLTELTQPGDFDLDGDVDGNDFLLWQRGDSPLPLSASDLADWKANHGAVANPAIAASTTVPEPATYILLLFAMMARFGFGLRSGLRNHGGQGTMGDKPWEHLELIIQEG